MDKSIKQAVIVAGGIGSRLRPLTNNRPKTMVEVGGRPFLEYLIELLKANGVEKVLLLLGYLPEKVIEHFGDGSKYGIKIEYSVAPVSYLNGARVKKASKYLEETFLLIFCDVYWPFNLKNIFKSYKKMGSKSMMCVYNNLDSKGEYGSKNTMILSDDNHVLDYVPLTEDNNVQGLDLGTYIFNKKDILDMPDGNLTIQEDFCRYQLIKNKKLAAYKTDHPYCTITDPSLIPVSAEYLKKWHLKIMKHENN